MCGVWRGRRARPSPTGPAPRPLPCAQVADTARHAVATGGGRAHEALSGAAVAPGDHKVPGEAAAGTKPGMAARRPGAGSSTGSAGHEQEQVRQGVGWDLLGCAADAPGDATALSPFWPPASAPKQPRKSSLRGRPAQADEQDAEAMVDVAERPAGNKTGGAGVGGAPGAAPGGGGGDGGTGVQAVESESAAAAKRGAGGADGAASVP